MQKIKLIGLLLLCGLATYGQSTLQQLGIRLGPHAVGFRLLTYTHNSLPPFRYAGFDMQPAPGASQALRTDLLYVWYPAAPGSQPAMRYGDYISAMPLHSTPNRKRAVDEGLVELGGDSLSPTAWLTLQNLVMAARRDASPSAGRHPLVLIPSWTAPTRTAFVAELLASEGFVVVVHNCYGYGTEYPDISVLGLEQQVNTLQAILQHLQGQLYINTAQVLTMGTGYPGTAAFALAMRSAAVRAYVSLESGITTSSEDEMLQQSPHYNIRMMNKPMLIISAPHPAVNPELPAKYKYALQYAAHYPRMSEHYFGDPGLLHHYVPNIIGRVPGNVVLGASAGMQQVVLFAKAHLRQEADARVQLEQQFATGKYDTLATLALRPALPTPPDVSELQHIIAQQGVTKAMEDMQRAWRADPDAFDSHTLKALVDWLGWRRDTDLTKRLQLSQFFCTQLPKHAAAQYYAGTFAFYRKDYTVARQHYARFQELIRNDTDPFLTPERRQLITKRVADNVKAMPAE